MKKRGFLYSILNPKNLIRFKDINIIISISIFVILSFALGAPVGKNKVLSAENVRENYNYQVLKEIPNTSVVNNVINELIVKECSLDDRNILECSNFSYELYQNTISFVNDDGITKNLHLVIDVFDIRTVYVGQVDPNYEAKERFTTEFYPHVEGEENYLIRFASDSLYFQAHPFGSEVLGQKYKPEITQVYYQTVLPEFSLSSENLTAENFGDYLLDQLVIGNENKVKLKAYTLTFLVGVLFTLITIIILWIFFRRNGLIKRFTEYYNIAAITSIPIAVIFFILLWFIPTLINIYIFIFSLIYILVLYKINTSEEIV